jgi:two-component system LytT family sensor kinase
MAAAAIQPSPPRWYWMASIWLGIGLFDATQTVFAMHAEGMHHAWGYLFLTVFLSWLPWALATPFVMHLSRSYSLTLRRAAPWFVHLGACALVGLVYAGWVAAMEYVWNPFLKSPWPVPLLHLWLSKFYNSLLSFLLLYATILIVAYVLDSRERMTRQETESARLNEQLSRAQLDALRRQIEPHFLFNTLNAIAGLIREERNDDAVNMIAGLSDFLRRVLEDSPRHEVPLGDEMAFLQKYLAIQKVRFGERLQWRIAVPSELLSASVPSLILQPIVENAIKHGIAKRAQGGAISISALRSNGMLTLNVYNDGPPLPANWEQSQSGIGLWNLRTRLQGLYDGKFDLTLRNQDPGGVQVSASMPFREG